MLYEMATGAPPFWGKAAEVQLGEVGEEGFGGGGDAPPERRVEVPDQEQQERDQGGEQPGQDQFPGGAPDLEREDQRVPQVPAVGGSDAVAGGPELVKIGELIERLLTNILREQLRNQPAPRPRGMHAHEPSATD